MVRMDMGKDVNVAIKGVYLSFAKIVNYNVGEVYLAHFWLIMFVKDYN